MFRRFAVNYLKSSENFDCLLGRNFSIATNQTCGKCIKSFIPSSQRSYVTNNIVNATLVRLIFSQNLIHFKCLTCRNFSTTNALFNKGSNIQKEERQLRILITILASAVLATLIIPLFMREHEDYVIIQPNEK